MHFRFTVAIVIALLSVVSAINHTVTVGKNNEDTFDPIFLSNVTAEDFIHFVFVSGVHSVTESTYEKPCNAKIPGWDSQVKIPNTSNITWTMKPSNMSGEPLWFYCSVGSHCNTYGMVFAINPNSTFTVQKFQERAKASGSNSSSSSSSVGTGSTGSTSISSLVSSSPTPTTVRGNLSPSQTSNETSADIKISTHRTTVALAVAVFIARLSL